MYTLEIVGVWHIASENLTQLYVHCPGKTTIRHVKGNGFLEIRNDCILKTETQILQNYKNSFKNVSFEFIPESNFSFDISELAHLKELMASKKQLNFSSPLNVDLDNLIKNMDQSKFKRKMLTFHNGYQSDSFLQKFVVNPTIMIIFVAVLVALLYLLCKRNKAQS